MRRISEYIFILLVPVLCAVPATQAQDICTFRGIVLSADADGNRHPVAFATVYWLGSDVYADCDSCGNFSIGRDRDNNTLLVASAMGYGADTLAVEHDADYLEVLLHPDNVLDEAVVTARQGANYLSGVANVKTEVISSAGLNKMACCNLAESFENSASVSVGYSDAVTGARQIRLLGLSGIYTAMLDENRPVMRGLAAPFGLSYIPGQWLESIQIAKGPSSVINGVEAISGQINVEHRKPTDEKPLFINAFINSMLMAELNAASSLQIGDRWSTVLMGHASSSFMPHDMNGDGFRDEPATTQFNLANRWLYYDDSGVQVRFGLKALYDTRTGGQMAFHKDQVDSLRTMAVPWGTSITNRAFNGYLKVGIPLNPDNSRNIAVVADYTCYGIDSYYGLKSFTGRQNSGFVNVMYQDIPDDSHRFTFGIRDFLDSYGQMLTDGFVTEDLPGVRTVSFADHDLSRTENSLGIYGEYTYSIGDRLSVVADLSLDWNSLYGLFLSPRANVKWAPAEWLVFRASGGRGIRSPNVVTDNLGMMSTGRRIDIAGDLEMESAWTYGGNVTVYIPIGFEDNCYFSIDYFRSDFTSQTIVDQEYDWSAVSVYSLDGPSYTNTFQADFSVEPFERFTLLATFRYTDSKVWLRDRGLSERPLVSRFKGVLNVQYATRMNIWTFDFTAQLNGPSRLPDFAVGPGESGMSPVYPVFFAQITRKFKGTDIYIGVENIGNYRQEHPVIGSDDPWSPDFNASVVWGPITGITAYAGVRFTLWK